jgi:hypothetical protein
VTEIILSSRRDCPKCGNEFLIENDRPKKLRSSEKKPSGSVKPIKTAQRSGSRADPPMLVALGHRTRATQLSQCPLLPPRGREAGPLRVGSHPLSCRHHLFPCTRLCAPSTFRGASEPTRTLSGEMHADFSCRAGKYPIPGHAAPQAQHVRVVQTQALHLTMFPRLQREVGSCDGRLQLRTGQTSRRFALAAKAHQQSAGSLPSRDLLLTYSVKSGFVAVNSGHT